ncbi:MAG: ArsR/SmtB family transcription factor [Candidatus Asgardarchaeia archaeon]
MFYGKLDEYVLKLLNVLGNETRVRILKLLSTSPKYVSQISRELNVGQQAILRHLKELEECGLIRSFKESGWKGPERKYYSLNDHVDLRLFISPKSFWVEVNRLDEIKRSLEEEYTSMEKLRKRIDKALSSIEYAYKCVKFEIKPDVELLESLESAKSTAFFMIKLIENLIDELNGMLG